MENRELPQDLEPQDVFQVRLRDSMRLLVKTGYVFLAWLIIVTIISIVALARAELFGTAAHQ